MSRQATPPDSAPQEPRPLAFRSGWAVGVFLAVAVAGVAADLASKHFVFQALLNDPASVRLMKSHLGDSAGNDPKYLLRFFRRPVCPGVQFSLYTNPGVVFGIKAPRWSVIAATGLVVVVVLGAFAWSERRDWPMHVALACILAGGLGNLFDRLFSEVRLPVEGAALLVRNEVRDFIDLSPVYPWSFNVADAWLVIGFAIFLLHGILHSRSARKSAAR